MLVEARTTDELQTALDGLFPGRRAGIRQEIHAIIFGSADLNSKSPNPAQQFARKVRCSMSLDPDAGTIWFEKWLPPDAA